MNRDKKLTALGSPYHGVLKKIGIIWYLERSGFPDMALPYMQYNRPRGGPATHLIDFGMPTPTRTTEQQAMDAANGWEWKNKAILRADNAYPYKYRLYGGTEEIDAPLWRSSDGSVWIVEADINYADVVDGMSASVTLTRFGALGVDPDIRVITTNVLSDAGQSSVDLSEFGNLQPYAELTSVSPDGSRQAYLALSSQESYVLGVLEITMSGTMIGGFTATLSVLYDVATTLGTGVASATTENDNVARMLRDVTADTQYDAQANKTTTSFLGDTWTPSGSASYGVMQGTYSVDTSISNRIIDVWYDSSNQPVPVYFNFTQSYAASYAISSEYSGSIVYDGDAPSEFYLISDDTVNSITWTMTQSLSGSFSVTAGAYSSTQSFGGSSSATLYDLAATYLADSDWSKTGTITLNDGTSFSGSLVRDEANPSPPWNWNTIITLAVHLGHIKLNLDDSSMLYAQVTWPTTDILHRTDLYPDSEMTYSHSVRSYFSVSAPSNNLLVMLHRKFLSNGSPPPAGAVEYIKGATLTPAGTVTTHADYVMSYNLPYTTDVASYNPVTDEVVWKFDYPTASIVTWM